MNIRKAIGLGISVTLLAGATYVVKNYNPINLKLSEYGKGIKVEVIPSQEKEFFSVKRTVDITARREFDNSHLISVSLSDNNQEIPGPISLLAEPYFNHIDPKKGLTIIYSIETLPGEEEIDDNTLEKHITENEADEIKKLKKINRQVALEKAKAREKAMDEFMDKADKFTKKVKALNETFEK